jgi:hypothetical protein
MNIFILDKNPAIAASQVFDAHSVKMPLESVQMLSTNIQTLLQENEYSSIQNLMKPTHSNHPCTIWARSSVENFKWLVDHTSALFKEYTVRYGKRHVRENYHLELFPYYERCMDILKNDGLIAITPFAQAMPDQFRCSDAVVAYHRYYEHKARLDIDKANAYLFGVKQSMENGSSRPRKPKIGFVWKRGIQPSWANFPTAENML